MATTPTRCFASAHPAFAPLAKTAKPTKPVNQNGAPVVNDRVLIDALRHFAEFGLGAAGEALRRARQARSASMPEQADKWLEICRALDRQMARQFEREEEQRQQASA